MKNSRKTFNIVALTVEIAACVNFAYLACWLLYALTHQTPVPPEKQLDNDFVPYFLLILLVIGTCVSGLAFAIHLSVWRMKMLKEKRETANRLP